MFDHLLYCISFLVENLWCHQTWFKLIPKSKVALSCAGSFAASKRFPIMHNPGIHKLPLSTTQKGPLCTLHNLGIHKLPPSTTKKRALCTIQASKRALLRRAWCAQNLGIHKRPLKRYLQGPSMHITLRVVLHTIRASTKQWALLTRAWGTAADTANLRGAHHA